jgi:O-antigen ligase
MISVFSVFKVLYPSAPQTSSIFHINAAVAATPNPLPSPPAEQNPSEAPKASQTPASNAASFDDIKHADLSAGERFEMWTTALHAIREAPFLGHGSLYLQHLITERYGYEHNHNQYLSWLVTGGILQLSIGLLFLGIPWLVSSGLDLPDRLIITLSVSLVWGASMIFDSYFNLKFYTHYYCMLIGLLFAMVNDMLARTTKADASP